MRKFIRRSSASFFSFCLWYSALRSRFFGVVWCDGATTTRGSALVSSFNFLTGSMLGFKSPWQQTRPTAEFHGRFLVSCLKHRSRDPKLRIWLRKISWHDILISTDALQKIRISPYWVGIRRPFKKQSDPKKRKQPNETIDMVAQCFWKGLHVIPTPPLVGPPYYSIYEIT